MAGKISVYGLGDFGVDIVKSPIHLPDGAWRRLQNAEFGQEEDQHAVKTRGSLVELTSVALAGEIRGLTDVPLNFPGDPTMMLSMGAGETESWKSSTDGSSFTDLTTSQLQRVAIADNLSIGGATGYNAGNFYVPVRPATIKNRFYYAGANYTPWVSGGVDTYSPPPVVIWDGSTSVEAFKIPTNPSSPDGSYPWFVRALLAHNGLLYLAVFDPGGTAPEPKGRVMAFNPENGTLSLVGERFGDDTGELSRGYPHCLASYLGQLWVGTNGITTSVGIPTPGSVWRITAGVESQWTEDRQLNGGVGYMDLAVYKGKLYAATGGAVGEAAHVEVRDANGTWATSYTAPVTGVSYVGGLIVFDGNLYGCFAIGGGSAQVLIEKFDNSSWSTDYNVGTQVSTAYRPGTPFVFGGELYFPFFHPTSDTNTGAFLLKRTTGGTWSQALSGVSLRGALGGYIAGVSS